MNNIDGLICGLCRGEKIMKKLGEHTLCPKCGGRGYLPNSEEIKEQQASKKRVLLKGQRVIVAINYVGECQDITLYGGNVNLADGTVSGYVKSIEVNYRATDNDTKNKNGVACLAQGKVYIELKDPVKMSMTDFVAYEDLDAAWAQTIIDNYLNSDSTNIKNWLNKELQQQYPPFVEAAQSPPWE